MYPWGELLQLPLPGSTNAEQTPIAAEEDVAIADGGRGKAGFTYRIASHLLIPFTGFYYGRDPIVREEIYQAGC